MSIIVEMQARHHDALDREGAGWMAAAGAAVGFSLHEASGAAWATSLLFIGLAVCTWIASFAAGIFRAAAHRTSLQQNLLLLMAAKMDALPHERAPFERGHDDYANLQVKWRKLQLWLLALGAVMYLVGSVLQSWERQVTPNDRQCVVIQEDMLLKQPRYADGRQLFKNLGCQVRKDGSVHSVSSKS